MAGSVFNGNVSNLQGQMFIGESSGSIIANIVSVAIMTPFFFFGFDVIPQVAEEIKLPLKRLGKLMILSIVLAVTFYVMIVVSVGLIMNSAEINGSMKATGLVTADAMAKAFSSSMMSKVLILGGLCGIITSWNSFMIGGSRALYSMAECYMIPHFFAKLSKKNKSPYCAIILVGALSVIAPFFGRQMLIWIVDASNFSCCLAYCIVSLSFIAIRKKHPELERPYKVKNYKLCGSLAVAMSGFMAVMYIIPTTSCALTWEEWIIVGGWASLGLMFGVMSKIKYKEKFAMNINEL